MRAGLLSSPEILKKLQKEYVCTWVLPEVAKDYANNAKSAEVRLFASTLVINFRPLVEMMVLTPDGRLIDRQGMNSDILDPFPQCVPPGPDLMTHFLKFLDESREKALKD